MLNKTEIEPHLYPKSKLQTPFYSFFFSFFYCDNLRFSASSRKLSQRRQLLFSFNHLDLFCDAGPKLEAELGVGSCKHPIQHADSPFVTLSVEPFYSNFHVHTLHI
jgi:hypothetical protein